MLKYQKSRLHLLRISFVVFGSLFRVFRTPCLSSSPPSSPSNVFGEGKGWGGEVFEGKEWWLGSAPGGAGQRTQRGRHWYVPWWREVIGTMSGEGPKVRSSLTTREKKTRPRQGREGTKEFKCGEGGTLCIETFWVRGGERLYQLCLKRQPVGSWFCHHTLRLEPHNVSYILALDLGLTWCLYHIIQIWVNVINHEIN